MSPRTYFEVAGEDRSQLAEQVRQQGARVAERLHAVRYVVPVMSGKGGVGKSYVTAGLAAQAATRFPGRVGVLDADLRSPTVAHMLAAAGPLRVTDTGVHPALGRDGVRVISSDLLLEEGRPLEWREPDGDHFLWRGTLEVGVMREFLADVVWGDLELLLIDLPPGTDGLADLHSLAPELLAGAVAVTIPSEEATRSVRRAIRSAADNGIRVLGVVENMSGYRCAECGDTQALFEGGGGEQLAREFGVPLLGRVPFDPAPLAQDTARATGDSVLDRLLERLA
jgi:ATP-binding protein involved in chromosome partitioning